VQNFRAIIIDGISPNYGDMLFILMIGLIFFLIGWLLIEMHDRDYGRLK
jgi:ABC-type polysaccharide/polyol phosphate export permease